MPPRRSARAAEKPVVAPKPVANPPTKQKAKTKTNTTKRRAESPDRSQSPPTKRSRASSQQSENEVPPSTPESEPSQVNGKQPSKSKSKASGSQAIRHTRLTTVPEGRTTNTPQTKPYFNPLPVPPAHARPGLMLFAWGAGNFGQFGMGPGVLNQVDKPKRNVWVEEQIEDGTFGEVGAGIESVSCGGTHTAFIDEKGSIWTCGVNDVGALGRITDNVPDPDNPGSFLDVDELTSVPHPLKSLEEEGFRAVQLAAGDNITAAVSDQGELKVWGSFRATEGALGFSTGFQNQFTPVSILKLSHKAGDIEKVSSVVAGFNHLLVLTTHGNIYTWGAGDFAQLGRKVIERRKIHGTVPEKITLGNRSRKAVLVGAGASSSFAVDDKGDVWGWGLNTMGQVGTGHDSSDDDMIHLPKRIGRLSKDELGEDKVVEISGGEHHTLFLTANGRVYVCGRTDGGQTGLADDDPAFEGEAVPEFIAEPTLMTFPDPSDPISHVSCGPRYNMATTKGGALYSWGQGPQGELGTDEDEIRTPHIIVRKEGGSWSAVGVSSGGQHVLGLFRKKT